jgi:hypothetical protein
VNTPLRLAAFAAAVGVAAGGAALTGAAIPAIHDGEDGGHAASHAADRHDAMASAGADEGAHAPVGLAVAEGGLRLEASETWLTRSTTTDRSFDIVDGEGARVTDFDVEHERAMHLIVVRRDLTGYQHLHPERTADGGWRVPLRLADAGVYRAYADFSSAGRSYTLGTDLFVAGDFAPTPLPAPAVADETDRYSAQLRADGVRAGAQADLAYDLSRDGGALRDIEPYLGADGHLVALREGDLAFLHVHPEQSRTPGRVRFRAELPSPGRYRLFLQFKHDGVVRTVAHTLEVAP